jgi:intraflagellar transport protein 81
MQAYVGANVQQRKSHREALNKKVQEQEAVGKTLRDRQKAIKDTHQPGLRQLDIWRNLDRLLACKLRTVQSPAGPAAAGAGGEADRLVL